MTLIIVKNKAKSSPHEDLQECRQTEHGAEPLKTNGIKPTPALPYGITAWRGCRGDRGRLNPATASAAAPAGFGIGSPAGESQSDVGGVVLLIDFEFGLGLAEVIEKAFVADASQEQVGVIRIERLAGLHGPDAVDLRFRIQIQPHDGQPAH